MEVYATEHEQLEAFKKWWKENGKAVIGGVILGLSVLLAFWAWRDYNQTQAEAASREYQLLIGEVEKGDTRAGLARGARILSQYNTTPYAVFTAFAMAKLEMEKGNTNAARTHLEWALNNADHDDVRHIARLRLARVMLDAGQAQAALKLLSSVEAGGFLDAYEETKGDSYLKLGQRDAAAAAYKKALAALPMEEVDKRELLEMKLDDLGQLKQRSAA